MYILGNEGTKKMTAVYSLEDAEEHEDIEEFSVGDSIYFQGDGDKQDSGLLSEEEKAVLRLLKLPLRKMPVYWRLGKDPKWTKETINCVEVVKEFNGWCVLSVDTETGEHAIHSAFLAEMQSPDFVQEYEASIMDVG